MCEKANLLNNESNSPDSYTHRRFFAQIYGVARTGGERSTNARSAGPARSRIRSFVTGSAKQPEQVEEMETVNGITRASTTWRTLCRGQGALRSPAGKIQVSAGMAFSKLRELCVWPLRWKWSLLPYQHSVWRRDRLGDRGSYLSRDASLTPKAGQRRARLLPIPRAGWVPAAQKNYEPTPLTATT